LFVGIAIGLFLEYQYALALAVTFSFLSVMYYSYVRPFRSRLHNVIIIFEDLMLLIIFIMMLHFACPYNFNPDNDYVEKLVTINGVEQTILATEAEVAAWNMSYYISMMVMILVAVPVLLSFIEFLIGLRFIGKVCNWSRIYFEEREPDYSSESSGKVSDDLRHEDEKDEDSLTVKEISLSMSDEDEEDDLMKNNTSGNSDDRQSRPDETDKSEADKTEQSVASVPDQSEKDGA